MNLSSGLMSCLSGNDAITLLEFIHKSLSCESKEDFAGLVLGVQELLSCDYAIAALGHHDDVRGVVIEDGVNISFPEGWCVEYEARNYVLIGEKQAVPWDHKPPGTFKYRQD